MQELLDYEKDEDYKDEYEYDNEVDDDYEEENDDEDSEDDENDYFIITNLDPIVEKTSFTVTRQNRIDLIKSTKRKNQRLPASSRLYTPASQSTPTKVAPTSFLSISKTFSGVNS